MNQAPEGMQPAVIVLETSYVLFERIIYGMPVFLPADRHRNLYDIGQAIARACWPQATYLYTEYANEQG